MNVDGQRACVASVDRWTSVLGITAAMATRYADALPHPLRFEPTPKRVPAEVADTTMADSENAVLVLRPEDDVRTERSKRSEQPMGDAV